MNWGTFATGLGTGLASLGSAFVEGEYQKKLQEDAQEFTKEQSQNQIKYNVQQLKDLGISPMMLFGGNATGGGAGGSSASKAPNISGALMQAINTVGNLWMRDKELDNKEKSLSNNERYIDMLEKKTNNDIELSREKANNDNAANTAKTLSYGAQERYWNQRYYNLDPNHPLNNRK